MSAPARLSSCNGSGDLSHARTRCPALSRFAAMTLPIRPVPRNPTSIISILRPHGQLGPARHAPLPAFVFDLRHESLAIISADAERSARGAAMRSALKQIRAWRRRDDHATATTAALIPPALGANVGARRRRA